MRFRQRPGEEVAERIGRVGEVEFFTGRRRLADVTLVVTRFPLRGERSAPDFVLVHGIGVSSRTYGPTAAALAAYGDVYLVDLPGYGYSPRPDGDLGIAGHARVLGQFLESAELDHPVVVGHSMGTQVAAQLAADFPHLVGHIALIGPVIVPSARSLPKALGLLLRDGLREPLWVSGMAVVDYLFRTGVGYMAQQIPHLIGADLDGVAARVDAKALVIVGEDDPIVPQDWARGLAARFRHGWFASVPGPHVSMFSAPERVAALLDEHARR